MSELIQENIGQKSYRGALLVTVCGLALLTSFVLAKEAQSEESDRPTVWIELGSQLERLSNTEDAYVPSFLSNFESHPFEPILPVQRPSRFAIGGEAKISFEPHGTDWVLSAAVRYGRSNGQKSSEQKLPTLRTFHVKTLFGAPGTGTQDIPYHLNASASNAESHAIIDFRAGKDVGLGVFSPRTASVFSVGVRFAQFTNRRKAGLNGVPDFVHTGTSAKYGTAKTHHRFFGTLDSEQSFRGVGPSISWDGSQSLLGDRNAEGMSVDWGMNAAVLFGRQKVRGVVGQIGDRYKTFIQINPGLGINTAYSGIASSYNHRTNINRSRSVIVPNFGGFAGLSFRYTNAKVSFGYRADFFFGAMDGGIETRKSYDRSFYGPFATISIGLGD